MTNKKIWFITGAGRGMGVDFAKAALASGHAVVASGRDRDRVSKALGQSNDLLAVTLDVTRRADAEAAVRAAVDRFGRIDVLVNNAASFYAGYFEELTPEQMDRQLAASLIGPMNVTRAVLPVMRKQGSGRIIGRRRCTPRLRRSASPPPSSTRVSSALSSSPSSRRTTPSRPSRTTTSAERSSSSSGKPRMASSPATRPSSRERSSSLRARSRRRAVSSPAPMPWPLRSRWSPI